VTNRVDELGHSTRYSYDEFNRVTSVTDPLGRTTTTSYAEPGGAGCGCSGTGGNHPTVITDANGHTTEMAYDVEWQLTSQMDAMGKTTTFTYDAVGNRITQTDARGNTYQWAYDSRNRVIAETNALNQVTTYAYDAGNRTNRVAATGEVTFWNYDLMNRVVTNGSGNVAYAYEYDAGGRRTAMKTIVSGTVTETTSYTNDLRNLLVTKVDPSGYTLSYGYDSVGNRTNMMVVATGGTNAVLSVGYTYDNRNRVETITGNGKTTTFGYDAASRRTSAEWPNDSTASYGYDDANEVLTIAHKTSGDADIASFSYAYDNDGNRTHMVTLEGTNAYTYAANNWLTGVTYPDARTQAFQYDAVGNRTNLVDSATGVSPVSYSYDAANRLLSSVSPVETNSYTYDAAGRLTNQLVNANARSFAYDFRSQMTGLTDTNFSTGSYAFDGDGNRVLVGMAGSAVRCVYDGSNVVLDLTNGVVQAAYVHGLGIDQPIERIQFISGVPDGRHVYHTDAIGSVWAMTDELQVTAKAYNYEAFGKIRSETGAGLLFLNRYTYTARESLGDNLGLYYYRWRVMDPNVGRFTSEDPLQFIDGVNTYIYVQNLPTTLIDATGRSIIFTDRPPGSSCEFFCLKGCNLCPFFVCTVIQEIGCSTCPTFELRILQAQVPFFLFGRVWIPCPQCNLA
jgi:RHS repeat-associated protein